MSWILDDICWCLDSNHCEHKDCFRHLSNRKATGMCTMAELENTMDCPHYEAEVTIAVEQLNSYQENPFTDWYADLSEMEEGGFNDEIL